MKTIVRLSLLAAVALAAGCSKSICDRSFELTDAVTAKVGACPDARTALSLSSTEPTEAEMNACDEQVKGCTARDEEKLNEGFDCIEALAPCEQGQDDAFTKAYFDCFQKAGTVSDACLGK